MFQADSFNAQSFITWYKDLNIQYSRKLDCFFCMDLQKTTASYLYARLIQMVVENLIENDECFEFDNVKIYMKYYTDDEFKKVRIKGGFNSIDFLKTNFSSYSLTFEYIHNGIIRTPYISSFTQLAIIQERTNNNARWYNKYTRDLRYYYKELLQYTKFKLTYSQVRYLLLEVQRELCKALATKCSFVLCRMSDGKPLIINYLGYGRKSIHKRKALLSKLTYIYRARESEFPYEGYYYMAINRPTYNKYLEDGVLRASGTCYRFWEILRVKAKSARIFVKIPLMYYDQFTEKVSVEIANPEFIFTRKRTDEELLNGNNMKYRLCGSFKDLTKINYV